MYIGEGYKRRRNTVSLANSDPRVIRLADHWIRRFSKNPVTYMFQYHADQDPDYLVKFWSFGLGVSPTLIKPQRKKQWPALGSHLALQTRSPHSPSI
jgi:hypothetical protein